MKSYVANRLFANPSFVEGLSRVVDLGATLQEYNRSKTDKEADTNALSNDWRAVGEDIKEASQKYAGQPAC